MTLNPQTTRYEFFGPPGTVAVTLVTTLVPYLLYFGCESVDQCPPNSMAALWTRLCSLTLADVFDLNISLFYLGWVGYLALLYYLIPGNWSKGTVLRNGKQLEYKINGFRSLLVTCALAFIAYRVYGADVFLYISDHYQHWLTAAWLFATAQAVFVYARSFRRTSPEEPVLLSVGGNSTCAFYNFFIGRELNPRVGNFDLKVFNELRPGIIGWLLLNFSFLIKQAHMLNGYITESMALVFFLQGVYIFDTFIYEASVLTTMDVTTDGFGWMLSFGDLVWVPFIFSTQARYLAMNPILLSPTFSVLVAILGITGYLIFRLSNSQKNIFRTNPRDPRVKGLKYIETESGSRLLITGWWGIARHINYLGDWLLGLSWCLTTGFNSPVPYFYALYFAVLLIHRERRDDHKCSTKYKKDWARYCKIVKYRIIPGVY
ncbi:erg24, C-14 sterol reductase [Dispira simplex]|nr:erg24, C-14 sterol reductase [Dispira simplex]